MKLSDLGVFPSTLTKLSVGRLVIDVDDGSAPSLANLRDLSAHNWQHPDLEPLMSLMSWGSV